jgi:hypothetical protein
MPRLFQYTYPELFSRSRAWKGEPINRKRGELPSFSVD